MSVLNQPTVAIVGGGVSGLAVAHFLAARSPARMVLLEAGDRLGGKVLTQDLQGSPVEAGPDGFAAEPALIGLCEELGLGPEIVAPRTLEAYLLEGGRLRALKPEEVRHLSGGGAMEFRCLSGGLQALIAELERRTPRLTVRLGTAVTGLQALPGGGFALRVGDGATLDADAVVLAVPAAQAARLLAGPVPAAAAALAEMRFLDLGVISLLYRGQPWSLTGSGFLARERPGWLMSGCTWLSAKWPHLAREDRTLMRPSVGGSGGREWVALDDRALVAEVHRELTEVLGPAPAPEASRVVRWAGGVIDYRHRDPDLLPRAQAALREVPGLYLAAGSYTGRGMAACVAEAVRQAEGVAAGLRAGSARSI